MDHQHAMYKNLRRQKYKHPYVYTSCEIHTVLPFPPICELCEWLYIWKKAKCDVV